MNEVFNTGLTFWQLVGGIIVLTVSAIAIKVTFNFDLNKYLERKDRRLDQKIKNTCTHIHMELTRHEKGRPIYEIQSLFESPHGTLQWQCQSCGLIRNHDNDYEKRAEYYAKNPDEYLKMNKKFQKLLKKSGAA